MDYLLIANATCSYHTLGIHHDFAKHVFVFAGWRVVLLEDHNFCCNKQEAMCLDNVRSGNKAVFLILGMEEALVAGVLFLIFGLKRNKSETNSCQERWGAFLCPC